LVEQYKDEKRRKKLRYLDIRIEEGLLRMQETRARTERQRALTRAIERSNPAPLTRANMSSHPAPPPVGDIEALVPDQFGIYDPDAAWQTELVDLNHNDSQ
jgi:hypothetical protein